MSNVVVQPEISTDAAEVIVPIDDFVHCGLYSRTATAKAGTMIAGLPHKKGGIAYLLLGTIMQIDGEQRYEVTAPQIIRTEPCSQRFAYAVTDCIYSTVHVSSSETTLEAEEEIFEGTPQITRIRNSFNELIERLGITEDEIKQDMTRLGNVIESTTNYTIKESLIHGYGCFASKSYGINDAIAVASINEERLGTARYINHSDNPNCEFVDYKDGIMLIAIKNIAEDTELLVDYSVRKELCQE